MPETIVCRHSPPRDLAATLAWARGLLILILLGWAFRQCLSVRDGFAAEQYDLDHAVLSGTLPPGHLSENVYWPIGTTALCFILLASSLTRFALDRRAIAALHGWAGATATDDGLELRLIGRLGCHAIRVPWDEVIGARLYRDIFNAPHVLVRATKRRRYKLPPYMEDAAGLVAEVSRRAQGVSRR